MRCKPTTPGPPEDPHLAYVSGADTCLSAMGPCLHRNIQPLTASASFLGTTTASSTDCGGAMVLLQLEPLTTCPTHAAVIFWATAGAEKAGLLYWKQ
jgi:hypothetical protein